MSPMRKRCNPCLKRLLILLCAIFPGGRRTFWVKQLGRQVYLGVREHQEN